MTEQLKKKVERAIRLIQAAGAKGNTPTEIAEMCGCKPSTVGASVTRSIQFLQRYFKRDKEL